MVGDMNRRHLLKLLSAAAALLSAIGLAKPERRFAKLDTFRFIESKPPLLPEPPAGEVLKLTSTSPLYTSEMRDLQKHRLELVAEMMRRQGITDIVRKTYG